MIATGTDTSTLMIQVPDSLGDHGPDGEAFYTSATRLSGDGLDMSQVSFIRPYGVIALLCVARNYHEQTHETLTLRNLQPRVHQYLERVDLFKVGGDYLRADRNLDETWDRKQPNPKLLELTPVSSANGVFTVIGQAERIFSYWLQVSNLHSLISVLSELCSNAYQHSGAPPGFVMIQTHEAVTKGQARVRLAICDMGIGVPGSLEKRFGPLGETPLDYLLIAMGGKTSRGTGRGGLGLRIVEKTVGESGGWMWLRSQTAALITDGNGYLTTYRDLPYIPGTQVAVEFHAPLN